MGKCSDVKTSNFVHKRLAILSQFVGHFFSSKSSGRIVRKFIGLPHFYKDLALSFLAKKKGQYKLAKMSKAISRSSPNISLLSRIEGVLFLGSFSFKTTECFYQPIDERFICIGNLHYGLVVGLPSVDISREISNKQGTLSINDASQIRNYGWVIGLFNVIESGHINLGLYRYSITRTQNKCLAAETNPEGTRKSEVIVRSLPKVREASRNDLLAA